MVKRSADVSSSDEELARRAQLGCAMSYEAILRRFQAPVLHFLRHRGAGVDTEDLVQETFLRAYERLHQYRPRWPFAAWLFTIARRISIDHHRRSRLETEGLAAEGALSRDRSPLAELVAKEERHRLWEVAARVLSEEQLTALWLHYVEGMSTQGIGLVLGCSRAKAKILLYRARKSLIPTLGATEGAGEEVGPSRRCGSAKKTERPYV